MKFTEDVLTSQQLTVNWHAIVFGGGMREGMQVGGHSEHGTSPVDANDLC
jgi:hypothetical protein